MVWDPTGAPIVFSICAYERERNTESPYTIFVSRHPLLGEQGRDEVKEYCRRAKAASLSEAYLTAMHFVGELIPAYQPIGTAYGGEVTCEPH